jgi:glycine reductase
VYELDMANTERRKDLPRVAYYFQAYTPQHDHHGISDPCFYGTEVSHFMPTIIHPNEVLDGGVVGDHVIRSTHSTQNHGVIKELYRRHGKELIFAGVVFGVASTDPVTRKRKALMAANLIKNVLRADGAVLTKIHGGMPHIDLALVGEECEKLGVRTAIFVEPLVSSGTLAEALLFNNESLNLIITMGATLERISLPLEADRILGGTAETNISCPDPVEQHAGDAVVNTEELSFAGIHDHLGDVRVAVREY